MKFGVRQVANVVFKAREKQKIGSLTFLPGQPVLYIDTAKISTIEENTPTTFYAVGGLNHIRLMGWDGGKELTFNVQDAILSPMSLALLSKGEIKNAAAQVPFHQISRDELVSNQGVIDLTQYLEPNQEIDSTAPIFVVNLDRHFDFTDQLLLDFRVSQSTNFQKGTIKGKTLEYTGNSAQEVSGKMVVADFYVKKNAQKITQLEINMNDFFGYYYYVQADMLFRRQYDGVDMPASLTFPNVKIQSNFTLSLVNSGDPNSFNFIMDAFPGYTFFNRDKKFLCVIEILEGYKTSAIIVKDSIDFNAEEEILVVSQASVYNKDDDTFVLWLIEEQKEIF